ncbi:MAG: 5-bromo-4-chloroindolyl phosphate hydrolysis family protein [Bilifractor sp.]|jgi:hypothetical protein
MKWRDILAAILSAGLFFALLMGARWNFLVAVLISVIVYFALTFLLAPRRKIGGVDVESMANGELIEEMLEDARKDISEIQKAGARASAPAIRQGAESLTRTGGSIIRYLEKHVDKIQQASRFLNYYLDTAADILTRYNEFQNSGAPAADMARVTENTTTAIRTLNDTFSSQYSKLLQGEVMSMEVDVDVLKSMAETDNGGSVFKNVGSGMTGVNSGAGSDGDPKTASSAGATGIPERNEGTDFLHESIFVQSKDKAGGNES